MSLIISYTHPLADKQNGERTAVVFLTRGPFGFRMRGQCHESNRLIGRWVGDDPRAVVEIGMAWLTSYGWDVRQGELPNQPDQLDVEQALALPQLMGDQGQVQDIVDALQQNFPPKHPTVAETGARVLLDRGSTVRTPVPGPAPAPQPQVHAGGSPEDVDALIERGRRKIRQGRDPQRIAEAVAERLGVSAAEAWYMLNPPSGAEDVEDEEGEVEPTPARRRRRAVEEEEVAPTPRRVARVERVQRVERAPMRASGDTVQGRVVRPLGRDEIPEVLTPEEARFLQSATVGDRDYEKMQRTHERAARARAMADAAAERNARLAAAVERGKEPRRRRRSREEEEEERLAAEAEEALAEAEGMVDEDEEYEDGDEGGFEDEDLDGEDEDLEDEDLDGEDEDLEDGELDGEDEDLDGEDEDLDGDDEELDEEAEEEGVEEEQAEEPPAEIVHVARPKNQPKLDGFVPLTEAMAAAGPPAADDAPATKRPRGGRRKAETQDATIAPTPTASTMTARNGRRVRKAEPQANPAGEA